MDEDSYKVQKNLQSGNSGGSSKVAHISKI